jgi:hypothetical protein
VQQERWHQCCDISAYYRDMCSLQQGHAAAEVQTQALRELQPLQRAPCHTLVWQRMLSKRTSKSVRALRQQQPQNSQNASARRGRARKETSHGGVEVGLGLRRLDACSQLVQVRAVLRLIKEPKQRKHCSPRPCVGSLFVKKNRKKKQASFFYTG